MLIRGRNVISIVSYEYRENITEALDQLKSVKTHEGVRYLLYFSVDKCDNDEIGNRQASIRVRTLHIGTSEGLLHKS